MHTAVLVIDVQHGLCEGPMHLIRTELQIQSAYVAGSDYTEKSNLNELLRRLYL